MHEQPLAGTVAAGLGNGVDGALGMGLGIIGGLDGNQAISAEVIDGAVQGSSLADVDDTVAAPLADEVEQGVGILRFVVKQGQDC